jgi:catechol 2,3-dioxygenase-like lactoylglutathione lyase family enzyme
VSGGASDRLGSVLRVGTVVMGATDVRRATTFWCRALGYVPRDAVVEDDWVVLVPADGGHGTRIALGRSETPVQEHPRVHLDLYAGDAADQAAEVQRLLSLGATDVDWDRYPDDPDFVILADTEGNRFCVIDTGRSG